MQISPPFVSYRETVSGRMHGECLTRSPNRLNSLSLSAAPLGDALVDQMERWEACGSDLMQRRAAMMAEAPDWGEAAARRLWAFGPDQIGANALLDCSSARSDLQEIRDACISAFSWVTKVPNILLVLL